MYQSQATAEESKIYKELGLSPERAERIKAAQKRHSVIDPTCENLTPEEFIDWHPVGGMSWEERSRRMKDAGISEPKELPALATVP